MRLRRYGLPFANTVIVIDIDMVTVSVTDVNDDIVILGIYDTVSRFFFARVFKGFQKV